MENLWLKANANFELTICVSKLLKEQSLAISQRV